MRKLVPGTVWIRYCPFIIKWSRDPERRGQLCGVVLLSGEEFCARHTQEFRDNARDKTTELWAQDGSMYRSPEVRAKKAVIWASDAFRENQRQKKIEYWTPEKREEQSVLKKQQFVENEEYYGTVTGLLRKYAQDSDIQAKRRATMADPNGYFQSEEAQIKRMLAKSGPNNPRWKGGMTNGYSTHFVQDSDYKEYIYARDGYVCQRCGCEVKGYSTNNKKKGKCKRMWVRHHINGDRLDDRPVNLITLCLGCHSYVHRLQYDKPFKLQFWMTYFTRKAITNMEAEAAGQPPPWSSILFLQELQGGTNITTGVTYD